MIRTVKVPTTVPRMGCTSGGDCCDSCRSHTGPPEGPPAIHTHSIPSVRNSALYSSLGTVNCDQDGNCYDDATGVFTPNPANQPATSMSGGSVSGIAMYVGVGLLGVLLLEAFSRRR